MIISSSKEPVRPINRNSVLLEMTVVVFSLQGKSALWSHLLNFQEIEEFDDPKSGNPNFLSPGKAHLSLFSVAITKKIDTVEQVFMNSVKSKDTELCISPIELFLKALIVISLQ